MAYAIYVHPLLGVLLLTALLWLAVVGLRARHRAKYAPAARRSHRRLGPWVLGLFVVEAVGGTASVALLRDDLEPATTWHFVAGWSAVVLMAVLWGLSRVMARYPAARTAHPLVGMLAVATGAAIGVLGFSLLP